MPNLGYSFFFCSSSLSYGFRQLSVPWIGLTDQGKLPCSSEGLVAFCCRPWQGISYRFWFLCELVALLVFKPQPQPHLSYAIAILELMQYSSTLGMPDSIYPRFDIVSNPHVTCRPSIWIATKYFYFWAINIVIPSEDWNLGPRVSV